MFFVLKTQFLIKLIHARHIGMMNSTMERLCWWIEQNIEMLYAREPLRLKFKKYEIPSKNERNIVDLLHRRHHEGCRLSLF